MSVDCARWQLRAQVLNIAACFWEPRGKIQVMASRIPLVVSLLLAPLAAHAQAPAAGDAKRGQALAYTCNGCHAIPNYKNVYPTYSVPKLHGQRPEYLVGRAQGLQERRTLPRHHAFAGRLDERAGHGRRGRLSRRRRKCSRNRGTTCRPTDRPKASEVCLACHGTNGVGITRRLPDHLRPASRLHRARAHRLPEGRPQERRHGGHGRESHAAKTSKRWPSTTRARSPR